MYPRSRLALLVLFWTAGVAAQAAPPHFLDPQAVDVAKLLPEPPGESCPETKAELELILRCQQACLGARPAEVRSRWM